jgi:hypothetical protein
MDARPSFILLLAVVGCGGNTSTGAARPPSSKRGPWSVRCALGPATAAPEPIRMTLGQDLRRASEAISTTLAALGYENQSGIPAVWTTKPRLSWPTSAPDSVVRHSYPGTGVDLVLGMARTSDSVVVLGSVMALCRSDSTSSDIIEGIAERLEAVPLRAALQAWNGR